MKPPVVTVPDDALDFDRPPRSAPVVAGASLTTSAFAGVAASVSTAAGSAFDSAFFETVRFCAGVVVGGASDASGAGFGVRRFSAKLRMTRGDGLKPDFGSFVGCIGGELSSACISGRDSLVALLTLELVTDGTFVVPWGIPNCLSAPPMNDVGASLAMAFSGTGSAILLLDLRSSNSLDTVFLISLSASASLRLFSFNEKLSLRCIVSNPPCSGVSFLVLLIGSTETKFVRTLENGRLVSPLLRALGDRPRTSGEAGWLLLSNMARRLRTPPPVPLDMAARGCFMRLSGSFPQSRLM